MTTATARVLGWFVIAHGVSHAILTLYYGLPASQWIDAIPVVLYAIGMIGFVGAGLGLLHLRPLDTAVAPLLVLASGLSLVAIIQFGEPVLWFGALCDAALLMTGLWRGYYGWPAPVDQHA